MKRFKRLSTLLAFGLLSACSTMKVVHDHSPDADFSGLKTWAYAPDQGELPKAETEQVGGGTPEIRAVVATEIESSLASKGFTKTGTATADFWVNAYGGIKQSVRYEPRAQFGAFQEQQLIDTSLVIDVVDPKDKKVIWRGSNEGNWTGKDKLEGEQNLRKIVDSILDEFPPKK